MDKDVIVTKMQFNPDDDADLYDILNSTSKRKRAYTLKKMLTEYVQIKELMGVYRTGLKPGITPKQHEKFQQQNQNHAGIDDIHFLISSLID